MATDEAILLTPSSYDMDSVNNTSPIAPTGAIEAHQGILASSASMQAYTVPSAAVAVVSTGDRSKPRAVELNPAAESRGFGRRSSGTFQPSAHIVTEQPRNRPFMDFLNVGSRVTYSLINQRHPETAAQFNRVITSVGSAVEKTAFNQSNEMSKRLSYGDMISSFLMDGEEVLSPTDSRKLLYSGLTFFNLDGSVCRSLPGGQALLTSQRMLLLSATTKEDGIFNREADLAYSIGITVSSSTVYLPIPLQCIKNLEMVSETKSTAEAKIRGNSGCCFNGCYGMFCCPSCLTQWIAQPLQRDHSATQVIRFGILMPPWQTKTTVEMNLPPALPLKNAMEFLSILQGLVKL